MIVPIQDSLDVIIKELNYIPTGMLDAYLEGKNLVPPSGWASPEHQLIASRYEEAKKKEAEIRLENNRRTYRSYGLDKKKS